MRVFRCRLCGKNAPYVEESTHCLDCTHALAYLKRHNVQGGYDRLHDLCERMTGECGWKVQMSVVAVVLTMLEKADR